MTEDKLIVISKDQLFKLVKELREMRKELRDLGYAKEQLIYALNVEQRLLNRILQDGGIEGLYNILHARKESYIKEAKKNYIWKKSNKEIEDGGLID